MTLKFLNVPEWSKPWVSHFGRGAKKENTGQYPSPQEMLAAFEEVSAALTAGLENASAEAMAAAAPPKTPPNDGTIGGILDFMAFHETYHVGQVAFLRCWLGHEGPQG
jgi:uncharacterized damage-inducible protein DinB